MRNSEELLILTTMIGSTGSRLTDKPALTACLPGGVGNRKIPRRILETHKKVVREKGHKTHRTKKLVCSCDGEDLT